MSDQCQWEVNGQCVDDLILCFLCFVVDFLCDRIIDLDKHDIRA